MRAIEKSPCSSPNKAPCSDLLTTPVVCVVRPVANTCDASACNTEAITTRVTMLDGALSEVSLLLLVAAVVTMTANTLANPARKSNPTRPIPEGPNTLGAARGAMAIAPKAATANILVDMLIPNCDGSK